KRLVPDYMAMGSAGMADMGEMEMPLPDNTLPMMTGFGQFGAIEMGGMLSVVKVREGLAAGDYKDPGWYKHPPGTVAWEWKGPVPASTSAPGPKPVPQGGAPVQVVKPRGGHGSH
ncbi:MAG: copper oxidase, partial [Reyranella sp.]|nr:copper oxidase [Reyranella sp.]